MDEFTSATQLGRMAGVSITPKSCVLALGDVATWWRSGRASPESREICLGDIDQLTADTLAEINPDLILSPLVTARFDCLDVACRLAALDYTGSYLAVARNLPNPHLVKREITSVCPDLDFDIIALPKLTARSN